MINAVPRPKEAPSWMVWSALWIVYIVWGSTYLAIRYTVRTMPPLLTAGARFLIAGVIAYAWLRLRKGRSGMSISLREAGASFLVGTALLLGGNGLVVIAEQKGAPSSLAALIISSVPLWVILWRSVTSDRIGGGTLFGVALGFSGVALLVLPGSRPSGVPAISLLLLVLASASWASGSFFSRYLPLPQDPFVSTAAQMLGGGASLVVAGLIRGEQNGLAVSSFSSASLIGFVYLIVFGSLLAFTAYVWLLSHAPISKVATYAYVNPVIAILLGWMVLSESITVMTLVGAAIIVSSVAFIVSRESKPTEPHSAGVTVAEAPVVPPLLEAEG